MWYWLRFSTFLFCDTFLASWHTPEQSVEIGHAAAVVSHSCLPSLRSSPPPSPAICPSVSTWLIMATSASIPPMEPLTQFSLLHELKEFCAGEYHSVEEICISSYTKGIVRKGSAALILLSIWWTCRMWTGIIFYRAWCDLHRSKIMHYHCHGIKIIHLKLKTYHGGRLKYSSNVSSRSITPRESGVTRSSSPIKGLKNLERRLRFGLFVCRWSCCFLAALVSLSLSLSLSLSVTSISGQCEEGSPLSPPLSSLRLTELRTLSPSSI